MTGLELDDQALAGDDQVARAGVREAFLAGLRPDPSVTVSEWADANRVLTSEASSESGPWRTSRTPYLREIMDCFSVTSPVRKVVLQKGSQVGGTEVGNNLLGYVIDHAPGPMAIVLPSDKVIRRHSRTRIDPVLASPSLKGKVVGKKSRESGNSTLEKHFRGGVLILCSAMSPGDLRSTPIRYLVEDEVDAYVQDLADEGDPVELAERGLRTYPGSKIFEVSTPTIEGRSRIARDFELTDRRYYHVPCPHCGELQRIEWARIKWDKPEGETRAQHYAALKGGEREVWLECEHCQERIPESAKPDMLRDKAAGGTAEWIPEAPENGDLERGYHLSALYAPLGWFAWSEIAAKFVRAEERPTLLKVWVNQVLGEAWRQKGEAPEWKALYLRRERYEFGTVPEGGLVLTAGVDVQRDRLEIEVVAWGEYLESWSVDYRVIAGDPASMDTWKELERLLASPWRHDSGVDLYLRMTAVDSGYATQDVYRWVRRQPRARVMAIKGRDNQQQILAQPRAQEVSVGGRTIQRGVVMWPVGVSVVKEELYGWLQADPPLPDQASPYGWCHWPQYGSEYFKQLTAEQLVARTKVRTGQRYYEWQSVRPRNEALDCRVYARAAATASGLDRWGPEQWAEARGELGIATVAERERQEELERETSDRRRSRERRVDLSRHKRRR